LVNGVRTTEGVGGGGKITDEIRSSRDLGLHIKVLVGSGNGRKKKPQKGGSGTRDSRNSASREVGVLA